MYKCFATISRGLENLLVNELITLGAKNTNSVKAGATFEANFSTIMKINLNSRLASRILIQVAFGNYQNENDIYDIAQNVKWDDWFNINNKIKVFTSAINSSLKSLEFITLKVKDSICDYFVAKCKSRPDVNKYNPDIRIYNFLTNDTATIYLDTSGEALFKRGYRQNKLEAPIKENLAAALIQLTNWDWQTPFYDPMCGSGTIAIEAINLGLNVAPGLKREFAFEKFLSFDKKSWHEQKTLAQEKIDLSRKLQVFASDINAQAIHIAKENIFNSKLLNHINLDIGDFLSKKAPNTNGVLLTNPPYGVRLEEQQHLAEFYPKLGSHLKNNYANWQCYFFTADFSLPKLMRLKPNRKTPLFNGSLECRLFEFKMVAGSNR